MQIAVKPLDVDAKQHFSPDAGPISEETCLLLRTSSRCAPETGAVARGFGPETWMLGRFQG